jgi:hypothetical protein
MNNMTNNFNKRFKILALCMTLIYFIVFGIPSQELAHVSEYKRLTEGRKISYNKIEDNNWLDVYSKSINLKIEEINDAADKGDTANAIILASQLKYIYKDYKKDTLKILESIEVKLNKEKISAGQKKLDDYRSLLNKRFIRFESLYSSLESGKLEVADELSALILPENDIPILGSLDNQNASIDPTSNILGSVVEIAEGDGAGGESYVQLPFTPTEDDLAEVEETKLDEDLKGLADGLDGPLDIYELVRNKIDFVPYYGSRKGAVGTYTSQRGNDYDQASLLIGLLRYKGYPARYVRGTMELSIAEAINWSGASTVEAAVRILGVLGSDVTILANGKVSVEHVWVETFVPYGEYRGAVTGEGESVWIPLDPSYKEYEKLEGLDPLEASGLCGEELSSLFVSDGSINDDALSTLENNIEAYLGDNWEEGYSLGELVGGRKIVEENLGMLPLTLPYPVISILSEFNIVQEADKDYVDFSLVGNAGFYVDYNPGAESSFTLRMSSVQLYGKRVSLCYVPATPEDEAIIKVYGDIFKTPVFLVDVKPQLLVDGVVVAEGGAWGNGYSQQFSMGIKHAGRSVKSVVNSVKAGDIYSVIFDFDVVDGVNVDGISDDLGAIGDGFSDEEVFSEAVMGKILDGVGKGYFSQLDSYCSLMAGGFNVSRVRQGGEAMVGYSSGLLYVLGVPTQYYGGNFTIDVDHNSSAVVSLDNTRSDELGFMVASGSMASSLEHVVMEQVFQLPGISAVKVMEEARSRNIPILDITKDNYAEMNSILSAPASVRLDIFYSMNDNTVISIPSRQINYYGWSGTGYIVSDTETGASAYRLCGSMSDSMSGGATAIKVGVGAIAALDIVLCVMDLMMLLQVMMPASGLVSFAVVPLPAVTAVVLLTLGCMSLTYSLVNYYHYLDTGDEQYAYNMLFSLIPNVAIFGAVKFLAKFGPSILFPYSAMFLDS